MLHRYFRLHAALHQPLSLLLAVSFPLLMGSSLMYSPAINAAMRSTVHVAPANENDAQSDPYALPPPLNATEPRAPNNQEPQLQQPAETSTPEDIPTVFAPTNDSTAPDHAPDSWRRQVESLQLSHGSYDGAANISPELNAPATNEPSVFAPQPQAPREAQGALAQPPQMAAVAGHRQGAQTADSHVLNRKQIREQTSKCETGRDMAACNTLGMHYLILAVDQGVDVELNMRLASHNLEKACAGGVKSACGFWTNALAMYGNYLISPLNPQPNFALGQELLAQSCEQNSPYGCAQLGRLYAEGYKQKPDQAKAMELYTKSCNLAQKPEYVLASKTDNNVGLGCFYLGQAYHNDRKLDPDYSKSMAVLNIACDLNSADACSTLAHIYNHRGDFVAAKQFSERSCYAGKTDECLAQAVQFHQAGNDFEANRLLTVGCKLNNLDACTLLASNLLSGIGIEQDPVKALDIVRHACSLNSSMACFYLAQLYHTGVTNIPNYNLAQNIKMAYNLYRRACALGSNAACSEMQRLVPNSPLPQPQVAAPATTQQ